MKKFDIKNLTAKFGEVEMTGEKIVSSVKDETLTVDFSYNNNHLFSVIWLNNEQINEYFDGGEPVFELWLHSLDKGLFNANDEFVNAIIEYPNLIGIDETLPTRYVQYKNELKQIINQNLKDFDWQENDILRIRNVIYEMRIIHENDID